jgi:hypothetical protein
MKKNILLIIAAISANFSTIAMPSDSESMATNTSAPLFTKIYSQVVSFNLPQGFAIVSSKQEAGNYVQKYSSPPSAEELEQDLFLFGLQGVAKTNNPIQQISELFKQATQSQCKDTFAMDDVGKFNTSTGQPAFVFLAGCGFRKPLEKSELSKTMSLFIVMQGKDDMYIFQWSEKSNSAKMPTLSWPVWRKRLEVLMPLSLQ